jgi:transcriptional regulator with PAS, ATPase and Fis domain
VTGGDRDVVLFGTCPGLAGGFAKGTILASFLAALEQAPVAGEAMDGGMQCKEAIYEAANISLPEELFDESDCLWPLPDAYRFADMVSRSPIMRAVFESISVLANNDATVLVSGESGTGKELAARAIHFEGRRRKGPFVAINCAAFPDSLLESELFGYERGAFTGAVQDRVGKVELATGGTLFLDEVGSISHGMQLKLLRVLERREVERLGGNRCIKVDMRVVAGTNTDLAQMIRDGRLREDFYYRINVVPLPLPPLRDRPEDIPLLVGHMLRSNANAREKGVLRLSRRALEQLAGYAWPGNVRELGNVIERAVLRASEAVIRDVDIPEDGWRKGAGETGPPSSEFEAPLKACLRGVEKEYLSYVLHKYDGSIVLSSRHALVDAATLHRKMKRHGLRRKDFRRR